jgi:hypothetical protein
MRVNGRAAGQTSVLGRKPVRVPGVDSVEKLESIYSAVCGRFFDLVSTGD